MTRRLDRKPVLFLAALALAAGLAPAPALPDAPPAAKAAGPVTIPFELVASNHMVVEAKINGKGPFRLIFDSGAPVSLLGNKAAEESGAVAKDAPKSFLMGLRGEGMIKSLEVGGLEAKDVPVIVADHPTLKAIGTYLRRPLDGLIGFTFFARYRTTIDYQTKVMTLEPVDYAIRDFMKELPERLAGPKVAKKRVLAPTGLYGLTLGDAVDDGLGVAIKEVRPGSPAEKAGLKPGDVLTTLDGRWTSNATDAYRAAQGAAPNAEVEAVVRREGQELKLPVRPVEGI